MAAAKPTPIPQISKQAKREGLGQEEAEALLLLDAASIRSCNIDKASLLKAGWGVPPASQVPQTKGPEQTAKSGTPD
jgi:hypothetical protein